MITLKGLSIGYMNGRHTKCVARGIDAGMKEGSLTCLVGSNGIGKSTLLRTIAGLVPPLEGSILIKDNATGELTDTGLLNDVDRARLISVVLTGHGDENMLSVYDVVSFGRIPYSGLWGGLSDADKDAISPAIGLVGIESLAECDINRLSDGERQKVMIAKALAQQTPVILLDEPSAFLDYPSKHELMRLLVNLAHNEGKTILLSSHDLDIISNYADSYWIMERSDAGSTLRQAKEYRFSTNTTT